MKIRSWLFVPGDSEAKLSKVAGYGADVIVVDLEDAVLPAAKPVARQMAQRWLVAHQKQVVAGGGYQRWVRINPIGGHLWRDDLALVMQGRPDGIVVPKAIGLEQIRTVAGEIYELEQRCGIAPGSTRLLPMVGESPLSALNIAEFAREEMPRLLGLTWGAEDLASAIGARRMRDANGEWREPFRTVRSQVLLAAHARLLAPIETVHAEYRDTVALKQIATDAQATGFVGMLAIHPAQVPVINAAFTPPPEQLAEARAIVDLFANNPGAGALQLRGRMVEQPHLLRAQRLLEWAG